jgi:hypothetical protein
MKIIKVEDIEESIGFKIENKSLISRIENLNLQYEFLNDDELASYIGAYEKVLESDLVRAGESRQNQWQNGWAENLEEFKQSGKFSDLIPKYHTKHNIAKFKGRIIKTFAKDFDYHLNSFFVDAYLLKFGLSFSKIFEFGCGTGYHLFRLQKELSEKQFYGLDWAESSQESISSYCLINDIKNIDSANFNYFSPDYSIDVKDSCIYTVASLEQIGEKHTEFLEYLLKSKPSLCIHFEPISEVFDDSNILDSLNKRYFEKRGYLKNYLLTLKELEKLGKISILETRRLLYGSKFVEGHTLIIWKPL